MDTTKETATKETAKRAETLEKSKSVAPKPEVPLGARPRAREVYTAATPFSGLAMPAIAVVAALYFARDFFIPLALSLAMLLSFALEPLAELLRRWHFGHVPSRPRPAHAHAGKGGLHPRTPPAGPEIDIDRLTRDEAMRAARYLAWVVGKAHTRQLDTGERHRWRKEMTRNYSK